MLRRRTALSFTAAAVLAATPLLTSCGTPHAGAAAVVGGKQITVSTVQARVDAVRAAQEKNPQAAQLIEASSDLPRNTVHTLVQAQVIEQAAKDAGITVTRREIQQARASAEQQAGGSSQLAAQLLQTYAMVPADIEDSIRTDLTLRKVEQRYGANVQTAAGQAKILDVLRRTSDELGVEVNPRYGSWNAKKLTLDTSKEPWITQVTKTSTTA
jgi:parvulin-like peptidyl-prolyl isomerase